MVNAECVRDRDQGNKQWNRDVDHMAEVIAEDMRASALDLSSLRSRAEAALRGWIVSGRLAPGELHTIRQIATQLGVSATPIREAVANLASQDLVEIVRNRGFRVVEFDERATQEILFIRRLVEVGALEHLAGKLDHSRVLYYRRLIEEMENIGDAGDISEYLDLSRKFHMGLIEQLGMPRLTRLVGDLRDRARLFAIENSPRQDANREHSKLLEAIARGDTRGVRETMTRHLHHHEGRWIGRDEVVEAETNAS